MRRRRRICWRRVTLPMHSPKRGMDAQSTDAVLCAGHGLTLAAGGEGGGGMAAWAPPPDPPTAITNPWRPLLLHLAAQPGHGVVVAVTYTGGGGAEARQSFVYPKSTSSFGPL